VESLKGQLRSEDEDFWRAWGALMAAVGKPECVNAPNKARAPAVDQSQRFRAVDRATPPELGVQKREKARQVESDDEDNIQDEPDWQNMDGNDPEYPVVSISGRKETDEGPLYQVVWGGPYEETTWEPLTNLSGCMAMVHEWDAAHNGDGPTLKRWNMQHRELLHEIAEQEELERQANSVPCPWCHHKYQKRGLGSHMRKCPQKPLTSQ
jgi:hypothetical protein